MTAIAGVVFSSSLDGHLRAYSTADGKIIWDYDTAREFKTVNGIPGRGGAMDVGGPIVAGGMLFVSSGYARRSLMPGNVLIAFARGGAVNLCMTFSVPSFGFGSHLHTPTVTTGNGGLGWRRIMAITLNHTIVPAHDKEASAKFFAQIFGLKYEGAMSHFAPIKVNETLTLDFDNRDRFEVHHYAFHVSDADFDVILGRIREAGIPYGSGPMSQEDIKTNTWNGGPGVYFKDPNGHVLELLTRA